MNVVLCGMPGAGKSVTSYALQKLTGKRAVDTDALIVEKYGRIADIFEQHGEAYFRDLETETCKKLAESDGLIIATGGGCVLRKQNVEYLKQNGKIIYLRAQKQTLVKRVSGNNERPLLAEGAEKRITELLAVRAPIYENIADIVIDTDELSTQQVAKNIIDLLKGDL